MTDCFARYILLCVHKHTYTCTYVCIYVTVLGVVKIRTVAHNLSQIDIVTIKPLKQD